MRIPFAYTSGLPITLGDRIQWSDAGNYVGGGSYQERGVGVVIEFGPAYVAVQCERGHRNSCSQKFGSDDRDLSNQRHSLWFDGYDSDNQVRHYSGLIERAD